MLGSMPARRGIPKLPVPKDAKLVQFQVERELWMKLANYCALHDLTIRTVMTAALKEALEPPRSDEDDQRELAL